MNAFKHSRMEGPFVDGNTEPNVILPEHIDSTIRAIADLQARHNRRSTTTQRTFTLLARALAQPRSMAVITFVIVGWIVGNLLVLQMGLGPVDPPPFFWLQGAVSVTALYTTMTILIAQRREDELGGLREQLTLELAILAEQKGAKTIDLLERLRRDMPTVPNRHDPEAAAMSKPADPMSVADAIIEHHEEAAMTIRNMHDDET